MSLSIERVPHSLLDRGGRAVFLMVAVFFLAPELGWIFWGPTLTPRAALSIERPMLLGSALLALLLPLMQIVMQIRLIGGDVIRGNRDAFPTLTGASARVARAHANLIESLVPFAAAMLVAESAGATTRVTAAAAVLFFSARVVHATTYTLGITVVRSAAFYAGLIATTEIAFEALRHA